MKYTILLISLCLFNMACAQKSNNPTFEEMLDKLLNTATVPTITCQELKTMQTEQVVYLLDAREKEEYNTSHLENARHIGYKNIQKDALQNIPKDASVVVYCTVGYRSEKITEKLIKKGYTNVHNLYGSIFEWVNQGNIVVDKDNKQTESVHTYNKDWSKWLFRGKKVY